MKCSSKREIRMVLPGISGEKESLIACFKRNFLKFKAENLIEYESSQKLKTHSFLVVKEKSIYHITSEEVLKNV